MFQKFSFIKQQMYYKICGEFFNSNYELIK